MATETQPTEQAPASSTAPEANSAQSKWQETLATLREKYSREPTPEELERDRLHTEEVARLAEEQEYNRRRANFREFIGVRRQYETANLTGWEFSEDPQIAARQKVVLDAVREFMRDVATHRSMGTGAIFFGPPGTGKDHFATAIIRAACRDGGHTARYVNGVEWYVSLRDSMDDENKSEGDLIRELCRPDWLVLSDPLPPVGDLSPYQSSMLYRAVDERDVRGQPTIVTINVKDGDEAVRRMGGPTWDRLKQGAWVFPCNWVSYRRPARVV